MSGLTRRSALAHRTPLRSMDGKAAIRERAFEGKLILRGKLEAVGGAVAAVLAALLPDTACSTASGEQAVVQWLSPDEWLIVTAPGYETTLAASLEKAVADNHSQIVDITDYYTTIELSGAHARDMLMKIATVDFHPRAFKPGMGVTTNFGRTVAWARQTREEAFDLIVRISMADYLWCLLSEAGREWGMPPQAPKGGDVRLHLPHFEAESAVSSSELAPVLEIT